MLLYTESTRSAAYYAAWALQEDAPEAASAVSVAKAYASDAYREVGNRAIQVHGGMGFTWENDAHLYLPARESLRGRMRRCELAPRAAGQAGGGSTTRARRRDRRGGCVAALESVFQWLSSYGYFALAGLLMLGIVGLPVPDETLLVFSGYLVYSGRLNLAGTLAAAVFGAMGGISGSYILGRCIGLPLIRSRFGLVFRITDEQIHRVHDWFMRIGHWSLFFGYFVPGVRHFTALVAGTSCLEYRYFALYAYAGAIFWVCSFVFIGLHFGEHWQTVIGAVEHNVRLASIIIGAVAGCYIVYRLAGRSRRY